jgi:methyl-accepting chemotaxis protein
MYISYDDGENWQSFQLNLPITSITDLATKDNDLVVATQGRSLWVLDDLSLVQQRSADLIKKRLHVFAVNDAYRMEGFQNVNIRNGGMNPANGVVFNYFLKDAGDSAKVSISVFDKQNKLIKTFSRDAKEAGDKLEFTNGMNRFVWNMLYPTAERIEGMILWNGVVGAPKAAPGRYNARFRYEKDSVDVPFVIKADPNYKMTEAQYEEQVSFLLEVQNKFNEIQRSIKDIRTIRTQLNDFTSRLDTSNSKELKKLADSIHKKVTRVEEALYQTKAKSGQDVLNFPIRLNDKISGLFDVASSGYNPPSSQVRATYQQLSADADKQLNALRQIMDNEVKAFNRLIHEKEVPVIGIKK